MIMTNSWGFNILTQVVATHCYM